MTHWMYDLETQYAEADEGVYGTMTDQDEGAVPLIEAEFPDIREGIRQGHWDDVVARPMASYDEQVANNRGARLLLAVKDRRIAQLEAIRTAAIERKKLRETLIWDALLGKTPTDGRTKAFKEHRVKAHQAVQAAEDRLDALLDDSE